MPKKLILSSPEKLKELLGAIMQQVGGICKSTYCLTLFNEAFTEEESPKWKPKEGEKVCKLYSNGNIIAITYTPEDKAEYDLGFIHPTREAAEAHKAAYLAWLSTKE